MNSERILNSTRLFFILLFLVFSVSTAAARSDEWWESNNEICRAENRYNQPMTFCYAASGGNAAGSEWISAEGEITQDTPDEFLKWLDGAGFDFRARVIFNSPGGNLLGGLRLGGIIRKRFFNTGIGATVPVPGMEDSFQRLEELNSGQCYSACAYTFLGGFERSYYVGASYGVHQFYDPRLLDIIENPEAPIATFGDLAETQFLTGLLVSYVDKMGASPRLVALAAATSPVVGSGIRLLTETEAKALEVINTKFDEPFGLTEIDGVLTARSIGYYLNRPIIRQVLCIESTMAVFVSMPSGANVDRWNGANFEINLGSFSRVGTFQILGPEIYENEPYTIYMLRIPVGDGEWSNIQRVGFADSWPFSHANESVSNGFEMGFENSNLLSLIGRNCR